MQIIFKTKYVYADYLFSGPSALLSLSPPFPYNNTIDTTDKARGKEVGKQITSQEIWLTSSVKSTILALYSKIYNAPNGLILEFWPIRFPTIRLHVILYY